MTAETLKPFLSFATATPTSESMEVKQKRLRMLFIFAGILFVALVMASLLSLTVSLVVFCCFFVVMSCLGSGDHFLAMKEIFDG